jgi:hypothetical protein
MKEECTLKLKPDIDSSSDFTAVVGERPIQAEARPEGMVDSIGERMPA